MKMKMKVKDSRVRWCSLLRGAGGGCNVISQHLRILRNFCEGQPGNLDSYTGMEDCALSTQD